MRSILLSLIVFLLSTSIVFAQRNMISGSLTIITEDNKPFNVYLNGVKFNANPAYSVRIEQINQATVNCRVEFVNSRNANANAVLKITDSKGYMQDITYSVSENRRGNNAFEVYQVIPLEPFDFQGYEQIYSYGNARVNLNNSYNNNNNNYSNGNTSGGPRRGNRGNTNYNNNYRPNIPNCQTISAGEMEGIMSQVKNSGMDNAKLELLQTISHSKCFSTAQVIVAVKQISFSANKLTFLKTAYETVLDPDNYYRVLEELSFSSDKKELTNYLNQNKRN